MLLDLSTLLRCTRCGARRFAVSSTAVTCEACGLVLPVRDGVLHAATGDEDPAIDRERQAVLELETGGPLASPFDFSMETLLAGPSALRTAFMALPYDDGSPFFRENEYFRNVSMYAATFDFVVRRLALPPGSRVLDVGADLTWSTARLAERGWRGVAVDINHHLTVSRIFREAGLEFSAVNVDMHAPLFADGVFDGVTTFNAMHHTHRLEPLVANLARVLRPGGRLGFIEPYWFHAHIREAFGATQIEAGINENVYRLEEWHQVFVNHGLEPVAFVVGASFHGVYEKVAAGASPRSLTLDQARDDVYQRFVPSAVAPQQAAVSAAPGAVFEVPVTVSNRSQAGWTSHSQIPVLLSYHLRQVTTGVDGVAGTTMLAFDNARSTLVQPIEAGADGVVQLRIVAPEQPGDYLLDVDLVLEGVTWFADRGGKTATIALRVT